MRAQVATSILPDEIQPLDDNVLLRPLTVSEKTRGGLYIPSNVAVMMKERNNALKRQFGAIVEQPRLTVVAVGPKVTKFAPGDEVLPHRKAVAFNGTAINVTGYGVFFVCKEEEIIAKVERLPEAEAAALYEEYKRLADEDDRGARGQALALDQDPPDEIAGLPELPDDGPRLVKP